MADFELIISFVISTLGYLVAGFSVFVLLGVLALPASFYLKSRKQKRERYGEKKKFTVSSFEVKYSQSLSNVEVDVSHRNKNIIQFTGSNRGSAPEHIDDLEEEHIGLKAA